MQTHVLKMIDLITRLGQLGFVMDGELNQDLILQSLPDSFSQFVLNFHMNKLNTSLPELLNMLKTAESHSKGDKAQVLLVDRKKQAMKKGMKRKFNPKKSIQKKYKKAKKADGACFHYGKTGHWKKNCKVYLASVKQDATGASKGLYMIQTNLSLSTSISNSWVLDTACGSHICNSLQGLHKIRRLKKGDFKLHGASGEIIHAEAVGTYLLLLPSGDVIKLEECFYVPDIIRNIISIPLLLQQGYEISVKSNGCSILYNNKIFGHGSFINGLLTLQLNDNIFLVDNKKRKRDNDNVTYLWHCRLGHISESRINKLVKDNYFDSNDFQSLGTCESCLKGKMTKSPFTGHGERATEKLGLVHTDVCGPMSTQARGGYSYFITFIDDLSRFGYVYLMKHKSEAFDRFKEYQNMVEK